MVVIAENWKALSGESNWEGLLDPIDNNLRRYLIEYGQLSGAPNDAFNEVKVSKGYALSRYPPDLLFSKVGLQNGNPFKYKVTDYLYARMETNILENFIGPNVSAFIGFVAESTDEGKLVLGRRDILVCWRGTGLPIEWFEDVRFDQVLASDIFPNSEAKIHHGFYYMYTTKNDETVYNKNSCREQLLAAIRRLVDKYYKEDPNEVVSITVVGHSLGAALATLSTVDIAANGCNKPTGSTTEYPVTGFAYATPRVGDTGFLTVYSGLKSCHILRIHNLPDYIPDLPLKDFIYKYEDIGALLEIDTTVSSYVKKASVSQAHDLNLYLHGISGYQGKNQTFELVINLDIALVNKYNDLLVASCNVPPKWWSKVLNNGMVQMDDGSWKLLDYVPDPPSDDVSETTTK